MVNFIAGVLTGWCAGMLVTGWVHRKGVGYVIRLWWERRKNKR